MSKLVDGVQYDTLVKIMGISIPIGAVMCFAAWIIAA